MTFTESIKACMVNKLFITSGRANRSEYWYGQLCFILIGFGFGVMSAMIPDKSAQEILLIPFFAFTLWFIIASLTSTIRRLHDIGQSGWAICIGFIPYLGALILLIYLCKESDNDNIYGPKPMK